MQNIQSQYGSRRGTVQYKCDTNVVQHQFGQNDIQSQTY